MKGFLYNELDEFLEENNEFWIFEYRKFFDIINKWVFIFLYSN